MRYQAAPRPDGEKADWRRCCCLHACLLRFNVANSVLQRRYFGGQFSLGTVADPHANLLSFFQFADARAAQHLHMDKNVRCVRSPGHEAVAFSAIEPFDGRFERRPPRNDVETRWPRNGLARRWRQGIVEHQQPARLQTSGALNRFANDTGAFLCDFEPGLPHAALVEKNISLRTCRRFYKTIALR